MNRQYKIEYLKDDYFGNTTIEFTDSIEADSPSQALVWVENDCSNSSRKKWDELRNWGADDSDYKHSIRITVD